MSGTMDGDAVSNVAALARAAAGKTVEIEGRAYSTTPLHDPRKPEPQPGNLGIHTLQGLAEYVRGPLDREYREKRKAFVHVASPTRVDLFTGLFGEFNQRTCLVSVEAIVPSIPFGGYVGPEEFNIALQAHFEPTTERAQVLAVVGGLKAEAVQTWEDDGVSQTATGRKGINTMAVVKVPNPVTLRPYRSFAEIAQVESPFILRLRGGGDGKFPACALFEADGGRWRLDAIERIKAWLKTEVGHVVEVYG